MSSTKYDAVKKIILENGSYSVPKEETIKNIQIMDLTVEEIKQICSNTITLSIVCKILKQDPYQLKKFCKYTKTFLENKQRTPKSIQVEIQKFIDKSKSVTDKTKLMDLPIELRENIMSKFKILLSKKMVLRDWIDKTNINWPNLSKNLNAIDLLKANISSIDWSDLSANPNAISLLKKYKQFINWRELSGNPNAIELLKKNIDRSDLDWRKLSANPNAVRDILSEPKNRINIVWESLLVNPNAIDLIVSLRNNSDRRIDKNIISSNPNAMDLFNKHGINIRWNWHRLSSNPGAIELLQEKLNANPDDKDIDWSELSKNPNAIELLRQYEHKINFNSLSGNSNPGAIELLRKHIDNPRIDWEKISLNPNAIELLRENPTKIVWYALSANPSIFVTEE